MREELLSTLYTLRAGLSLVAGQADEAKKARTGGEKLYNDVVTQTKKKLSSIEYNKNQRLEENNRIRAHIALEYTLTNKPIPDTKKEKKDLCGTVAGIFIFAIIGILLLAFCVWIVYYMVHDNIDLDNPFLELLYGWSFKGDLREWVDKNNGWVRPLSMMGGWILAGVTFPGGIVFIIGSFGYIGSLKLSISTLKAAKKNRKEAFTAKHATEERIRKERELIRKNEQSVATTPKRLSEVKAEGRKQINALQPQLNTYWQKVEFHVSAGRALYDMLRDYYASFLDPRDWKYIDYLIFAIETARADSVKEALQLCDREVQTKRIIDEIHAANTAICRTINAGFRSMEAEMQRSVSALSLEMKKNTAYVLSGMNALAQSIEAMGESQRQESINLQQYVASLTQATTINNALIARQAQSSEKLVENVSRLRQLADKTNYANGYQF